MGDSLTESRRKRKGREKKSTLKFWQDRINTLKGPVYNPRKIHDQIVDNDPGLKEVPYVKGEWTAIKLSILAYYMDIYTSIIKNRFDKNMCYIDTFSGPGIVVIQQKSKQMDPLYLFGSPVLAVFVPKERAKFDRYIFIEKDDKRYRYLRKVIDTLSNQGYLSQNSYQVINADMNTVNYRKIILENKCSHSLVFIDPEGLEPKWRTVRSILYMPVDVLFNFITFGVRRIWGRAIRGSCEEEKLITEFYGDDSWRNASGSNDLLDIYIDKIQSIPRRIALSIKVKITRSIYYDIILATRKTRGNNPYLRPVRNLKKKIEETKLEEFDKILDVITGRRATLL